MSLITIAIPCFNARPWIEEAVRSALAQTWTDKEIIVADDGSTDGSLEVLTWFGSAIQLIRNEHRGGNHARNSALGAARGEWVQFLDADDYLEPQKLAKQLEETSNGAAADVVYSPTWIEDLGEKTRNLQTIDTSLDVAGQWLAWQLPQTGGALWRKASLDALGGWNEAQPCCQEHELYLRALEAGQRFVFAPSAHAVYRIWSEQTVCRKDPAQVIRTKTTLLDRLAARMKARGTWTPEHGRIAGRACFEMARTLAKYDLAAAAEYHRDRTRHGLIKLEGPAAPRSYQLVHRLFGFTPAERLARICR